MRGLLIGLSVSEHRTAASWRSWHLWQMPSAFLHKLIGPTATGQPALSSGQQVKTARSFAVCGNRQARHSTNSRKVSPVLPSFLAAEKHLGRIALVDHKDQYLYDDLLHHSIKMSLVLNGLCGKDAQMLNHKRVGVLCENDASYIISTWATWMANGVAVPLSKSHPVSELEYFIRDSVCSILVASKLYADKLLPLSSQLNIPLHVIDDCDLKQDYAANEWFISEKATTPKAIGKVKKIRPKRWFDLHFFNNGFKNDPAMIVYTSGTTGNPKGVVLTHGNLSAMVSAMTSAWAWCSSDVILHALPLHHVHGIVNALLTPLSNGAACLMLPKFDPHKVWSCLVNPLSSTGGVRVNLFMAVPTMYVKLIQHYEAELHRGRRSRLMSEYIKSVCKERIRLMVSGSAPLPQPVLEKWESITGHRLLERYGMTEIGMALTTPLEGPRIPGTVGSPFPTVEVCVAKSNVYAKNGYDVLAIGNSKRTIVQPGHEGESGELFVKGPSVFHQYWNRLDATSDSFTPDGWFKTGDTVKVDNGVYKILGRTSVDIIKSGGYKISALGIERHLLSHPAVLDCAVVGLPDITWGQRVAAVVVLKEGCTLTLEELKIWARDVLPSYQIPSVLRTLPSMPRNALGKLNKKDLVAAAFPQFLKQL